MSGRAARSIKRFLAATRVEGEGVDRKKERWLKRLYNTSPAREKTKFRRLSTVTYQKMKVRLDYQRLEENTSGSLQT